MDNLDGVCVQKAKQQPKKRARAINSRTDPVISEADYEDDSDAGSKS